MEAALTLAAERPVDQITYKDVAERCEVHWTTVRRHLGSRDEMRKEIQLHASVKQPSLTDTKSRLLQAAARVFAQQGYAGATLDQIGAAAGLTKGAVYWHFSSKSDLYLALLESDLADIFHEMPQSIEQLTHAEDMGKALSYWLTDIILEKCRIDQDKNLLFYEFLASSRDVAVKEKLKTLYTFSHASMNQIVKELQDQMLIVDRVAPESLTFLVSALVDGLILWFTICPEKLSPQRLREITNLLWTGIRPE